MVSLTLVVIAVPSSTPLGYNTLPTDTSTTLAFRMPTGASVGVPRLSYAGKESVEDFEHSCCAVNEEPISDKHRVKGAENYYVVSSLATTPTVVITGTASPGLTIESCFRPSSFDGSS